VSVGVFKLLRRFICLIVIAVITFVMLSLWSGGEGFRWLGERLKQQSDLVGEKADMLRVKGERALKAIEDMRDRIRGKKEKKSGDRGGESH